MHTKHPQTWQHNHHFLDDEAIQSGQRRVLYVLALTTVTMFVEIIAGTLYNSMALVADGWHMASHSAAMGITLYAYWYARGKAKDRRYSFGTGKVSVLGGFSSALVLGVVALMMVWESVDRIITPLPISFDQAIIVAGVGLVVNLVSVWLLHGSDHHHDHGHSHSHAHAHDHQGEHHHEDAHDAHHGHHGEDHNLRAAYLHVMADVLTSVLAIVALLSGKWMGWTWMDPIMGIVGALVIAKWSYGLLRDTSAVLLDGSIDEHVVGHIKKDIEADADNLVSDIHVWRVGTSHMAAVVSVVTHDPQPPEHYKALLSGHKELAHVTVEVNRCPGDRCA